MDKCGPYTHFTVVVSRRRLRDGFRKTYWVYCVQCDFERGPFDHGLAQMAAITYQP